MLVAHELTKKSSRECTCKNTDYRDNAIDVNGLCAPCHTLFCTGGIFFASVQIAHFQALLEAKEAQLEELKLQMLATRYAFESAQSKFTWGGRAWK